MNMLLQRLATVVVPLALLLAALPQQGRAATQLKIIETAKCPIAAWRAQSGEGLPVILLAGLAILAEEYLVGLVSEFGKKSAEYLHHVAAELTKDVGYRDRSVLPTFAYRRLLDGKFKLHFGCLIVVRGQFGEPDLASFGLSWMKPYRMQVAQTFELAALPDLYVELAVAKLAGERKADSTPTGFVLEPVYLEYNARGPERESADSRYDLTLMLSIDQLKDGATSEVVGAQVFAWNGLVEGESREKSARAGWIPLPALNSDESASNDPEVVAINITAEIVESGEGPGLFKALAREIKNLIGSR